MDFLLIRKELKAIEDTLFRQYQTFELFPYENESGELKFFNRISDLKLFIKLGTMSSDCREYLKIWLKIYQKFPDRFRPKILVRTEKDTKVKDLFRREDLFMGVSEFSDFKLLLTKNEK